MQLCRRAVSPSLAKPFRLLFVFAAVVCLSACSFFGRGPEPERLTEYLVQDGDTLSSIAKKFGTTAKRVVDINQIYSPRLLSVGAAIKVPDGEGETNYSEALRVKLGRASEIVGLIDWPLEEGRITSTFGQRGERFHDGVDIGAARGTPIYAAHDGVVVYSGSGLNGYGNAIIIRGDGLFTLYGHNRKNLVSRGDSVGKGEKIAEVGATGDATAPHLHFEVRLPRADNKNFAVDPLAFFPAAPFDSDRRVALRRRER